MWYNIGSLRVVPCWKQLIAKQCWTSEQLTGSEMATNHKYCKHISMWWCVTICDASRAWSWELRKPVPPSSVHWYSGAGVITSGESNCFRIASKKSLENHRKPCEVVLVKVLTADHRWVPPTLFENDMQMRRDFEQWKSGMSFCVRNRSHYYRRV